MRLIVFLPLLLMTAVPGLAEEPDPESNAATPKSEGIGELIQDDWVALNPKKTVLVDRADRSVFVKAKVIQTDVALEMFMTRAGHREHEAILAFDGRAYVIHAGLIATGLKPGKPVAYSPFSPPSGPEIDVIVHWRTAEGTFKKSRAQDLMRHATRRYHDIPLKTLPEGLKIPDDSPLRYLSDYKELSWYGHMTAAQRDRHLKMSDDDAWQAAIREIHKRSAITPMGAKFVFAGSILEKSDAGDVRYGAEGGDVICVANFPTAMIDVAQASSDSTESLLYESRPDRLPPVGTEVLVELKPAKQDSVKNPPGKPKAEKPSAPSEKPE